jgi:hypothetical protein
MAEQRMIVDSVFVLAFEIGMINPVAEGSPATCHYCNEDGYIVNMVCPFCGGGE